MSGELPGSGEDGTANPREVWSAGQKSQRRGTNVSWPRTIRAMSPGKIWLTQPCNGRRGRGTASRETCVPGEELGASSSLGEVESKGPERFSIPSGPHCPGLGTCSSWRTNG